LLVSLATACAPDGPVGEGPSVVATTTILGDVVANIVGEDARVEVLMPAGSDAHEFQASAAQVSRIHQADLVVVNGLGLEEGLLQVLAAAAADGVRVLEVAPPLDPLPLDDGHDHPGDLDPHVWMDPVRMADAVRLIATALTEAAPD